LPYRVRWQDLKDLIRKAGTVLRADVSLTPDNRSRGYGTVLLATEEDALRAVNMFQGFSWQGRTLEVRIDRSGTLLLPTTPIGEEGSGQSALLDVPNPSMSLSQGDSSHGLSNSAPLLFVGNLPFHCQWQDLKDLFRAAGNIQRADVALTPEGRSRGFGTVLFSSPDDAQNAVRIYHGYEYSGRTLKVHFDR
ncbi:RNA-binding domain-containing protein, partial [Ceraceosorus guamensis]